VRVVAGEEVRRETEEYCNAQRNALQGVFDKFVRLVYRKGLFKIVTSGGGEMVGTFGATQLRAYIWLGRIVFTFARPKKKSEVRVTFKRLSDDALGLGIGVGRGPIEASLSVACAMIEDVIIRWPTSYEKQKALFRNNNAIAPAAIHLLRSVANSLTKK
jgi:hypothetical protein